ncbi:MAG: DNA double-strand break repair nuclease NurA [Chloroflexi bacterium]|nr:DNA double-strand break repair nuclease NurA [Chloroflexota bacterium]
MSLELSKLTAQVEVMGAALAQRRQDDAALLAQARSMLLAHGQVTDELRRKVATAHEADISWRGADPLGARLDERHAPAVEPRPATLIAADGSQIYPDRHGIALYYLLNTGSIVLRQGGSQAPAVSTNPEVFYEDADLYDETGRPRDPEYINSQRDRRELEALADLAEAERIALGGDLARPIVVLTDGPLLRWTPQRITDREVVREVHHFTAQLERLRRSQAVPFGYVDRPSSANVLRTVELTTLAAEEITRETVRHGRFRPLADRALFDDLAPNQRTGFFASTSDLNDRYRRAGHRIVFFYLNVAQRPGPENALIVRIELPEWAAHESAGLDVAQAAVYADCALSGFPYVLARAHELAVVGYVERHSLEAMLGQAMLRCGLQPVASTKAEAKRLTGSRSRR